MNQLPDRCPAVDDTTDARLTSRIEAVLAKLDLEGVDRYDTHAAIACFQAHACAPNACIALYQHWLSHQFLAR